jgi:flagellar FliJ protein
VSRDQLELVQQLAERQEKESANRLASVQGALASAQSQLNQVLSYREDYHRLAVGEGGSIVDTNQLQTARHFLSELDSIAGKQQKAVQQAELLLDQHRVGWIESKRRLQAIQRLRRSRGLESQRQQEKLSQRLLDDLFGVQQAFAKAR